MEGMAATCTTYEKGKDTVKEALKGGEISVGGVDSPSNPETLQ